VSLSPLLYLFVKSSEAAVQSILHTLFLPSALKSVSGTDTGSTQNKEKAEYIKAGALYAECEPVQLPGNSEERFAGEESGRLIWEYLERELAQWRKSEEAAFPEKEKSHAPKT